MDDIIRVIDHPDGPQKRRLFVAKNRRGAIAKPKTMYMGTAKEVVNGVAEALLEVGLNATVVFDSVITVLLESDGLKLGDTGRFEKVFIHFDENIACIEHSEGREIFSSTRRLRDCFKTQFDLNDPQSLDKLQEWLLKRKSRLQSCKD